MILRADRAARHVWDLIIVGSGPSGCQAAIYAASEGLSTLIVSPEPPGGQIALTPLVENYAGVVNGFSGGAFAHGLSAQLTKFGVGEVRSAATGVRRGIVRLTDGPDLRGHSIIIATGATWADVEVDGATDLITEGRLRLGPAGCLQTDLSGQSVVVVGGGNSAGQLVCELSRRTSDVTVVCRSTLRTSAYLTTRIEGAMNVRVVEGAHPTEFRPRGQSGVFLSLSDGSNLPADSLILCGGTVPNTRWLIDSDVTLDSDGAIITGSPHLTRPLETVVPGVFAIGDCRSGAVRRLGAAVGDGSNVLPQLYDCLAKPGCLECSC